MGEHGTVDAYLIPAVSTVLNALQRLVPASQILFGTDYPLAQKVELRLFNDRALNRDLAVLCERVHQASLRLPDGRRLSFTIRSSCCILAAQMRHHQKILYMG